MSPSILALALLQAPLLAQTDVAHAALLVCGSDKVLAVDWSKGTPHARSLVDFAASEAVPADLRSRFRTIDECKSVGEGTVLVASSGGAIAIVDDGRVRIAAPVVNAHSLELLPGDRAVAAASIGAGGNRLVVLDLSSGAVTQEFELESAHGVEYDASRKKLYALGMGELMTFAVDPESGEIALDTRTPLPEGERADGHDLRAVPRSAELIVTTAEHVWLYDRDLLRFRAHPLLGNLSHVKSVDVHPLTGRIAYVQATETQWWSSRVQFANPVGELGLEGERFYKARWTNDESAAKPPATAMADVTFHDGAGVGPDAPHVHLVFGSCADEDEGTATAWRRVGALAPDAMVLLGDTPYIDSTDLEVQRRRHAEFLAFPPFVDLARSTPMHATWDDHDFGRNDTNGLLAGKENARMAWVEAHSRPPFRGPYGTDGQGIHSSFRRGPVEVFLLDTRWFAGTAPSDFDPEQPTLLGSAQWEWLRAGLAASTAPFKVLACGMIWNGAVRPGKTDHWGAYPAEFEALCRFLGEAQVSGVVLVGGDIHRSRVVEHDTTATVGYPLVELIVSPMHERIIKSANAPHPGLRFDTGAGHVVLELAADAERLIATFHTPDAVLHQRTLTRADTHR